jgi:hypothetical protein
VSAESHKTLTAALRRRVFFIARFCYWAVRHRSISSARWLLAYEGITWN